MRLGYGLLAAILALTPAAATAADYRGAGAPPVIQEAETLHIGPGRHYEVLATIRPGTAPHLKFCQYHGRWCYGSYGRWDGWFYGGSNTWDHWGVGYLFGW